jgi:DNA-binding LacI/PurR family transcriptional regulator
VQFEVIYGTYEISSGYKRMRVVIENNSLWPSAIFAANDRVALGVIQALLESGHKVPDDISLLGYDDQPALADQVHPALTTITLPHLEMGQLAVDALLEQIASGRRSGPFVAHPQLIVRDSIRNIGPPIHLPDNQPKSPPSGNGLRRQQKKTGRADRAPDHPAKH